VAVDALCVFIEGEFEVVFIVGVFLEGLVALFAKVLGVEVFVLFVLDVLQSN
jgi:hypothetical protein